MGPEQLGELIDHHGPALILFARQWCSAAEDAVQEAFLKLSALRTDPDRPVAWLYRVVRNRAISDGRSERRRRHYEGIASAATPTWFVPTEEARLDAVVAADALTRLPAEEREVIVARLWGELTFEEIGALIDAAPATAYRRYVAGLTALRKHMGEPCPNCPTN